MSETTSPSLLTKLKIAGIAVIGILVLIIVLQNTEAVETKILFATLTVPRAVLLFGTMIVGYVLGIFTTARWIGRKT